MALGDDHPDALAPAPIDPSAASLADASASGTRTRPPGAPVPGSSAPDESAAGHAKVVAQKIVLAGVSNMAAACVTNPFDLIKVRQQLEARTGGGTTNWFTTMTRMIRSEGAASVYKGLSASLLREASYSGIRMGTYDLCKSVTLKLNPWANEGSFVTKLSAGMASGMMGAAIANPADLLKVRMQTLGAQGSLASHFNSIVSTRGVVGLYRAVLPTMLRAGILTSAQLGVYDHAKHTLMDDFPNVFAEGFSTHFAASGIAGFACSAASSPVDVVKVRMMSDQTGTYRNAIHCAGTVLKQEGPFVFFRGFSMCFLRLWPHSVLSLLVFEQLRKLTGIAPI